MQNKYLITQSLLSSWQYGLVSGEGYEEFLKTLRGEPFQQSAAMLEGKRFESRLNAFLRGKTINPDEEWYKPITLIYKSLQGAQQQVSASRDMTVDGVDFVLYGRLDFLKAGVIYDTKYSKKYKYGKYLDSPQHSMYFALVPEAYEFEYIICDGEDVYTEAYRPEDTEPIERIIKRFVDFLTKTNLIETYFNNWKSKY